MLQKRHGNAKRLFPLKEVNNFSPSRINSLSNIDDAEIAGPRWCDIHPDNLPGRGWSSKNQWDKVVCFLKIQIAKDSHIYHIYILYICIYLIIYPFWFPRKWFWKKTNWMLLGPFWGHIHLPTLSPTPESSDVLSPKEFHQTRARSAQRSP